jgi:monothiol glutaredoxin
MSLDPALRSRIESILNANRVVLFMKGQPSMPQCGFSAKAVGALQDLGVEFAHVNVLADQEIREGIKAYGDWPTIPQLYIDGELVGGSDIVLQMAASGELSSVLGLAAPDRTPPSITVTPAAVEMLKGALADARALPCSCPSTPVSSRTSSWPRTTKARSPPSPTACACSSTWPAPVAPTASPSTGWTTSAARAWPSTTRTRPSRCRKSACAMPTTWCVPATSPWWTCARPTSAIAAVGVPFKTFDGNGRAALEALPKDTALAFMCHHGGRSAQAAEQFRALGFTKVFNVTGGINAWSEDVDNGVPKY